MTTRSAEHTCPAPGCSRSTRRDQFACFHHWVVLPAALRAEIWRAYRAGDLEATVRCYGEADAVWGAP